MTSRDAITTDCNQNMTKCLPLYPSSMVQRWSLKHHPNRNYDHFSIFLFCMGIYRKTPISSHKTPITFFLRMEMASNFQETRKTKFYAMKSQHGSLAHANYEIFRKNLRGEKKSPPPHQNRVNILTLHSK